MDQYTLMSDINISIIEILLISTIAFIGAFIHEYISFIKRGKRITLVVWFNIFITVIIDIIISASINPFIMSINTRLILLPPLIIGLLGTELAIKLSTINGSTSFIEYILGFLKIKRADTTSTPYNNSDDNVDYDNSSIDDEIIKINAQIEMVIQEYELSKDNEKFIEIYKFLKNKAFTIKTELDEEYKDEEIPLYIALKLSEMMKLEISLDKIFKNIKDSSTHL